MLKLKKLQILGFKSFCDRSELKFHGEGIAAIIGPNGCGKSNIADAICWVLGEQSAKTLRGSRMEDVIFAGTRDRKPTGMAEVSLTLIDPEAYDGPPITEVEVDVQNELAQQEDWDEASVRAKAEQEAQDYIEEVHPHQTEEAATVPQAATGEGTPAGEGAIASQDQAAVAAADATDTAESTQTAVAMELQARPQVVLKIRRRKFNASKFHKGEIVVTRRLFRTGDSEYLLNGKLCRLRDIQDIFMGTGLGPESYAIIEQGRIGQILSSRPTDRRAVIEEAAGITKFKTRKRLAEARLEEAKQNLARLNDIFDEVTRQMNSLKRQASKAERYARLREEMRAKLRLVLASKYSALQNERAALEQQLETFSQEILQRTEEVRGLENEHGGCTQRGYDLEVEARATRERVGQITRENDRALSRQKTNEERCQELATRAESASRDAAQAAVRLKALELERDTSRQVLESAAGELAAAQQEAAQRQEEARAATAALAGVERGQEQSRLTVMQAVSDAAAVRSEIIKASEQIAAYDREAGRFTAEVSAANAQLEAFGAQRTQQTLEFETAADRVSGLTALIENTRQQIERKRAEEAECKRRLDTLRTEYATALGRKASLEGVIAEHGYSTESVRRLFRSGALENGFRPVGVLADFLEVEDRYEQVVDDFLRDELNYIVVKSWDAANHGLQLLRTDADGRATFLVHPDDAQAKFSFTLGEAAHAAPRPQDQVVALKECIRVLDGFGKSLEVILPKLRDGYIVPESKLARELALENPNAFFLANNGECFHNVTVTGGKQRAEGPLAMKRELREVAKLAGKMEEALRQQERRAALLGKEISELTSLLERLEAEKREADKQAVTSGALLQQIESEMARARERLAVCERELKQVAGLRSEAETLVASRQQELAQLETRRDELERSIALAQESLDRLRAARDQAAQATSEIMARVAGMEERRRAAAAVVQRVDSLLTEARTRIESLEAQAESASAEKAQRETENQEISGQLIALAAERQEAEARVEALQSESLQLRTRLADIEQQLKAARESLDATRERRGELAAQAAKLESDSAHMSETSVDELGIGPAELLQDRTLNKVTGEELAQQDAEYKQMRGKLEAMGPVNMMALEEYNETAQRHQFLETQRKDLLDSIENTQKTIREIETVSRQKFEEAFHRINENFQATFRKLFGGGSAFMRLTDEENSAESGIDVVASPPGKKLQNVLLLSGGEKALTALALLMGIFQYQPSPFCILDEVDAPLDESNIGRFTELVREMSEQTQFIIITHSKKTMGVAPVLYGVTMQEPGVSKLVSVRFHEHPAGMTA